MSFEVVYGTKALRNLSQIAKAQVKVDSRVEVAHRKVLETSARCFLGEVMHEGSEVRLSGRVVTRVVYMDEHDAFNSEERTDNFNEKLILAGAETVVSITPTAHILETKVVDSNSTNHVEVQNVIDITILGLVSTDMSFVRDLQGDVEVRREKVALSTFGMKLESRFEVEETIDLDKNCEGVLGTDLSAYIRDIIVGDGKVTVKGAVCVNVMGVRRVEEVSVYNDMMEFDFSKTITNAQIGLNDHVMGSISVTNIQVRAESKERPQLVVTAELNFAGHTVMNEEIEQISDSFSFTNALSFNQRAVPGAAALPQHNSVIEVDGNVSMNDKTPFITRVVSVGHSVINSINIVPVNDKITIEGVMTTALTFECEERHLHATMITVPFHATVKIDGISATHAIQSHMVVLSAKVKARRGKELLVDARLGLSIASHTVKTQNILSDVILGDVIPRDDSAILIYTVGAGETLWDVAKRINCRMSEIIAGNPEAEHGLKAGDKIFIYRQQVVNF